MRPQEIDHVRKHMHHQLLQITSPLSQHSSQADGHAFDRLIIDNVKKYNALQHNTQNALQDFLSGDKNIALNDIAMMQQKSSLLLKTGATAISSLLSSYNKISQMNF